MTEPQQATINKERNKIRALKGAIDAKRNFENGSIDELELSRVFNKVSLHRHVHQFVASSMWSDEMTADEAIEFINNEYGRDYFEGI